MRWRSAVFGMTVLLLAATPARSQVVDSLVQGRDTIVVLELNPEDAQRVIGLYNDPGTIHFSGRSRVPAGRTITGDVGILGGPLEVAGRIEGGLLVINGDVEFVPGALVTGDVAVVGGRVSGTERAEIGGEIRVYPEPLRYRRRDGRIVLADESSPAEGEPALDDPDRFFSRGDFLIATGQSYNRVEGMPITFGPVIETAGSNPFRLRALAVYRSESGFDPDIDELGYYVRAEQYLGGRMRYRVGGTVHSFVDAIEDWHLSDLENGLATFLLRRDYRDHYERVGGSVFAGIDPPGLPLSLTATVRWEDHASLASGSPWTLFRNAESWRPQPLVAEGELTSVALGATYDTRSSVDDPAWGWYVTGEVERSFGTELTRPAAIQFEAPNTFPPQLLAVSGQQFGNFTAGFVDIRRYNRVSPDSRLNFRLLVGGSLIGSPLPPQRQHALGGVGSLPGYRLFEIDCGARSEVVHREDDVDPSRPGPGDVPSFFPRYGCDSFALFQVEYRGKMGLRLDWSGDPRGEEDQDRNDSVLGWGWSASPDWVVFVDAARGWALDRPGSEDLAADVGIGLALERVGIFMAVPLTGETELNVFARLGPRF